MKSARFINQKRIALGNSEGFTLIELLVVIGILAVLLAITLIAINPAHQFAQANNTKRRSDALQILNAIGQYTAENKGNLPTEVGTLKGATPNVKRLNATNFPNLCGELIPTYIPALPTDPSLNSPDITSTDCSAATPNWDTDYQISVDGDGRVTVSAITTDENAVISVTR